jgi:heterodisulfide reductase subunit B
MSYGYYPGCSLSRSASPYDTSTKAIADPLGIDLVEVDDWNCCGATEYIAINKTAAYALVGRNLALAAGQDGLEEIVAPCSACYLNLKKADHYMGQYEELNTKVNAALAAGGLSFQPGSLKVRHLIDVVINDVGYEAIGEKVSNPLSGLRLAPYYGCLIVRPQFETPGLDDPEYPTHLDKLLDTLGAEVVDFPLKTHCCGGHMAQISAETAYELIRRLLQNATDYEADAIVTICPMCQLNLDAYQNQVNRHFGTNYQLPVLYFTQMIGLALGIDAKELGIGKEIVPAKSVLRKIGTEVPSDESGKARKRRKDDQSLPMPKAKVEG